MNVNGGLEIKLGMNDFVDCMQEYDVLFLSECWVNETHQLELNGFAKPYCKFRKRKNKGKRDSGGLCVYFRDELTGGIENISWDFEDGIVLKLKGSFFRMGK